jgi:hypothetical protein
MSMQKDKDLNSASNATTELNGRREALKKLGKYSVYVAPFTVLALSKKASAATGHGPGSSMYRVGGGSVE